jgi:hypothetical protein
MTSCRPGNIVLDYRYRSMLTSLRVISGWGNNVAKSVVHKSDIDHENYNFHLMFNMETRWFHNASTQLPSNRISYSHFGGSRSESLHVGFLSWPRAFKVSFSPSRKKVVTLNQAITTTAHIFLNASFIMRIIFNALQSMQLKTWRQIAQISINKYSTNFGNRLRGQRFKTADTINSHWTQSHSIYLPSQSQLI